MFTRIRALLQPAHVRDFDPFAPQAPGDEMLALEPRILLDAALAETFEEVSGGGRTFASDRPVVDLNGGAEGGTDHAVDYPDRLVSSTLASEDAFVLDPEGELAALEIAFGGDLQEDMDAVRVGDRIVTLSRDAELSDVRVGEGLFDVSYDATTRTMRIVDAVAPGEPVSARDVSRLVQTIEYGNLSLEERRGTITVDFTAVDAEGNRSAPSRSTVSVDVTSGTPYADLDPNGDNSVDGLYRATFREGDNDGVAIADLDIAIEGSEQTPIKQAYITLSNPQDGDELLLQIPDDIEDVTAHTRRLEDGSIRVTIFGSTDSDAENFERMARVIQSVQFVNDSEDPSEVTRLISVRLQQGQVWGLPTRLRVDVVPRNDAPTVDLDTVEREPYGPDYRARWIEGDPAVGIIAPGLNDIEDVDDDTLEGATIVVANAEAGDALIVQDNLPDGIRASFEAGGTQITLSGTATKEAYGRALEAIRFRSDPDRPVAGERHVNVTVRDPLTRSNTATAYITVEGVNTPPEHVPGGPLDRQQEGLDGTALLPVRAADSFRDRDDTDIAYALGPDAPAWLNIDADTGIITGTPPADASQVPDPQTGRPGRYAVTVVATDPQGASGEATVVYLIGNPAPVAANDAASAGDGGPPITGSVIAGREGEGRDVDPDGDAIRVERVEGAPGNVGEPVPGSAGGTFVLRADGTYTFDPGRDFLALAPDEARTTQVTYGITDDQGGTDTATLVVTVLGTNNAPVAQDDALRAAADRPASGNLLIDNGAGPDRDPDGDRIRIVRVNGEPLVAGERVTLASGASLAVQPGGGYTYDPGRAFEALPLGETARDTFTYTIRDPFGLRSTATATVTVRGTNEPPIPLDPTRPPADPTDPDGPPTDPRDPRQPPVDPDNYIPIQAHLDGETMEPFALRPWFGDPDRGDVLTVSVDETALPDDLTFDPATQSLSGTFAADASQGGRGGVYVVPVTVTDRAGATFTTNLTITVANPEPIARDDRFAVTVGDTVSGNALANNGAGRDVDPDGDELRVSEPTTPVGGSEGGRFLFRPNGAVRFDPAADFDDLARGQTRETTATYTVTDDEGGRATATVTVTVTGANGAPVAEDVPDRRGIDARPLAPFRASEHVRDADGDRLSYRLAPGAPDWLAIDADTGRVTGTPPADASQNGPDGNGRYPVTVLVGDGEAETALDVVWTIRNPAPEAANDAMRTDADRPVAGNVLRNDVDPDGDRLSIEPGRAAGTAGGLFVFRADGTVRFDPRGEFADLSANESRVTRATYTVTDNEGGTSTATVTVRVGGTNAAPEASPADRQRGVDARPIAAFDASALVTDRDGDALRFALGPDAPDWMAIDPRTGTVTGTPPRDASAGGPAGDGTYAVTIRVSDGEASVDLPVTWRIVNPGPDARDDTMRVPGDRAARVDLLANDTDPDGDRIRVVEIEGVPMRTGDAMDLPSGARLVMHGPNDLRWVPGPDHRALAVGATVSETFRYTIVDAQGARSTATARVEVHGTVAPEVPWCPAPPEVVLPPADPYPPLLPPFRGDPILTVAIEEIDRLGPPVAIDPYSPVPILTQALEGIERLGGDVSLFGTPSLREALDRVTDGDASDARWRLLVGDVFRGHELTVGGVTFRSTVAGDVLFLDLGSFGGAGYDAWRVRGDGGGRIAMLDRNIAQIERPAHRDHVHLDVHARGPDGVRRVVPLRVDTVWGEIRAEGAMRTSEPPAPRVTFADRARLALQAAEPNVPVVGNGLVVDLAKPLARPADGMCVPDDDGGPPSR